MSSKTNITQEERQIIKLIEKMPLPEEEKTAWAERIRNGEMSAEMAEEIRLKLAEVQEGETDVDQARRTRSQVELSTLVKRWRFSSQSRNFGKK